MALRNNRFSMTWRIDCKNMRRWRLDCFCRFTVLKSDAREKRGFPSQGYWARLCLARLHPPARVKRRYAFRLRVRLQPLLASTRPEIRLLNSGVPSVLHSISKFFEFLHSIARLHMGRSLRSAPHLVTIYGPMYIRLSVT